MILKVFSESQGVIDLHADPAIILQITLYNNEVLELFWFGRGHRIAIRLDGGDGNHEDGRAFGTIRNR